MRHAILNSLPEPETHRGSHPQPVHLPDVLTTQVAENQPMNEDLTPQDQRRAWWILAMNTFAFTVCFAAWMMNGVLITFLVDNGVHDWDAAQMGWLIGIPVLTGAIFRLPLGSGNGQVGRAVRVRKACCWSPPRFRCTWSAIATPTGSSSRRVWGSDSQVRAFAVGIAYTSVWFPKRLQGTALGIFGAGNAGRSTDAVGAPRVLRWLTDNGRESRRMAHSAEDLRRSCWSSLASCSSSRPRTAFPREALRRP